MANKIIKRHAYKRELIKLFQLKIYEEEEYILDAIKFVADSMQCTDLYALKSMLHLAGEAYKLGFRVNGNQLMQPLTFKAVE